MPHTGNFCVAKKKLLFNLCNAIARRKTHRWTFTGATDYYQWFNLSNPCFPTGAITSTSSVFLESKNTILYRVSITQSIWAKEKTKSTCHFAQTERNKTFFLRWVNYLYLIFWRYCLDRGNIFYLLITHSPASLVCTTHKQYRNTTLTFWYDWIFKE